MPVSTRIVRCPTCGAPLGVIDQGRLHAVTVIRAEADGRLTLYCVRRLAEGQPCGGTWTWYPARRQAG